MRSDITNDVYTNCIVNVHITQQQLATTHKGSDVLVSGRTLHAVASGVIMAAKKILSLLPLAVNSKLIEKTVEWYIFPSGKTIENLTEFILFQMHNWDLFYGKVNNIVEVKINKDNRKLKMITKEGVMM